MSNNTFKTVELPPCPDWSSNADDETLLEDLTVTFRPETLNSAQATLVDNPSFIGIDIDAAVDGETDGKLKDVRLHITSYDVTCVVENEWTGTKWGFNITDRI